MIQNLVPPETSASGFLENLEEVILNNKFSRNSEHDASEFSFWVTSQNYLYTLYIMTHIFIIFLKFLRK